MKTKILILALIAICKLSKGQQSPWLWAKNAWGMAQENYSIASDQSGNVFVTGVHQGVMVLDTYTLAASPGYTGFYAKYDATGNVAWAMNVTGTAPVLCQNIATDANGNIYVSGRGSGTVSVGSYTFIIDQGGPAFILKADPNGSVIWAKELGAEESKGIAADAAGNVYFTSYFVGAVWFGPYMFNSTGNFLYEDIVICKLDGQGNVVWAKQVGGTDKDVPSGICVSPNGNVNLVGGALSPTIAFGAYSFTNSGTNLGFIVQYDGSGNVLWAKSPEGNAVVNGVSADPWGNIYITGGFSSPGANFGSYSLTTADTDIYTVKYGNAGNELWAKSQGAVSSAESGLGITTDASGDVYVGGTYSCSALPVGNYTLTNDSSTSNLFVISYNAAGQLGRVQSLGGKNRELLGGITTDPAGNIFVGGSFEGTTSVIGTYTLANDGGYLYQLCFFIAKTGGAFVGIPELEPDNGAISIYPNPSDGQFRIRSSVVEMNGMDIFDISGKKVYSSDALLGNEAAPDLSGSAPGIYLIQIKTAEGILPKKIIIQ